MPAWVEASEGVYIAHWRLDGLVDNALPHYTNHVLNQSIDVSKNWKANLTGRNERIIEIPTPR